MKWKSLKRFSLPVVLLTLSAFLVAFEDGAVLFPQNSTIHAQETRSHLSAERDSQ